MPQSRSSNASAVVPASTRSFGSAAAGPSEPRHFGFWPARVPHRITPPATSLWHNLAVSALRYPDRSAMVFFGTVTTYKQLLVQAERLAACLQLLGVARGDRVLLDMQNCPQLVIAHWAILRADAVVVPVNPMNRAQELKHCIADPDAKVAITTADLAAELAAASNGLDAPLRLTHLVVTHLSDAFDEQVQGDNAPPAAWVPWLTSRHPLPRLDGGAVLAWDAAMATPQSPAPLRNGPRDLAVLPYTSGTTGLPKGCMHPHASIMHQAVANGLVNGASAENVVLAAVPMFHATGMVGLIHAGASVWPAEVESLMFRHPAIQNVCVIATRDPDRGETVKAIVVLRPAVRGTVREQDIIGWCHDNMAVYKAPRVVQFADALPLSGTGKVLWRQLQEQEGI